jgi:type IV secretion system protein VirD4
MYKLTRLLLILMVCIIGWTALAISIVAPGVWVIVLIVVACKMARRGYQLTAYGTARFADASDLQGMTGQGVIIGRVDSRLPWAARIKALFSPAVSSEEACKQFLGKGGALVRLAKAVHVAVFGPTGAGKGVSIVIPHLLTCTDSMVVIDPKGENARITADARKAMGHRIVRLDPFKVVTDTPDTFNPLDFIDPDSPTALDECRALAEALVVRTGQEKEPHWLDSAEVWIGAMIAAVVYFGKGTDKSLQAVRTLLSDPVRIEAIIKLMCESDAWQGMLARLGQQLQHFKDKELGSTLTTSNRFMRFLDTLVIADSTKASSFNPEDLRKGKLTVYLILPTEHLRTQSPLLRMWIGSLIRACIRGGMQGTNKVQFVLDEAASLGHMDVLDDAVDKLRAYLIQVLFIYQSLGQLKTCWPDGSDQTVLSNTSQVYFAINDNQTADYVSARLGEFTNVATSGGASSGTSYQHNDHGNGSSSYSKTYSENWQQHGRRLYRPEELMALPPNIAITFTPGVPPIRSKLVKYWDEDFYRPSRVRKAWAAFKTFAATAAVVLFISFLAMGIAAGAWFKHSPKPPSGVIHDPLQGFNNNPFERR